MTTDQHLLQSRKLSSWLCLDAVHLKLVRQTPHALIAVWATFLFRLTDTKPIPYPRTRLGDWCLSTRYNAPLYRLPTVLHFSHTSVLNKLPWGTLSHTYLLLLTRLQTLQSASLQPVLWPRLIVWSQKSHLMDLQNLIHAQLCTHEIRKPSIAFNYAEKYSLIEKRTSENVKKNFQFQLKKFKKTETNFNSNFYSFWIVSPSTISVEWYNDFHSFYPDPYWPLRVAGRRLQCGHHDRQKCAPFDAISDSDWCLLEGHIPPIFFLDIILEHCHLWCQRRQFVASRWLNRQTCVWWMVHHQ